MPELPEVETVKESLRRRVLNKTINSVDVYWDKTISGISVKDFKRALKNQTIREIKRRGKWLIFLLDDYALLSHLRMEGKYFLKDSLEEKCKHEHVIFKFTSGDSLRYNDTRKFGKMHIASIDNWQDYPALSKLGLEPWDDKLDKLYLKKAFEKKTIAIKTALLDQSIITGIGNIYADEILFLSKISPFRKARELTTLELSKIIINTRLVLEKAISEGGTTIRSYTSEEGVSGLFQNDLHVHTKAGEACPVCKTEIIKTKVGGRGTYYCPQCQKK